MNSKQLNIVLGGAIAILLMGLIYMATRDNSREQALSEQGSVNVNANLSATPQNTNTAPVNAGTNSVPPANVNQNNTQIPGWKTYSGNVEQSRYQVSYPQAWRIVEQNNQGVGFGPRTIDGEVVWTISPENQKSRLKSTIIADLEADAQKEGLTVKKTNITLPAGPATRLVFSKPDTDFVTNYLVLQVGEIVYTFHAGPQLNVTESFEQFYNSFRVTTK